MAKMMMKDLVSVALIVLALVVVCELSVGHGHAANTESEADARVQEYVDAHNEARAEVGVGPLRWSEQLAHEASLVVRYQRDRYDCNFARLSGWKYGANQLQEFGGTVLPPWPSLVVESWVGEKNYYNHSANSCAPNHHCGWYTQVVWRKSLELGCAMPICDDIPVALTICLYNPRGNYKGQTPY